MVELKILIVLISDHPFLLPFGINSFSTSLQFCSYVVEAIHDIIINLVQTIHVRRPCFRILGSYQARGTAKFVTSCYNCG